MYGPSDMYGDMNLEDVDEFEGLQMDDGREISPGSKFQRDEFRNFDTDFREGLDDDSRYLPDDYDEACSAQWEDDEEALQDGEEIEL